MTLAPIAAGFFQAVSITPPQEAKDFLPWALALVLSALLFMFWLREKDRTASSTEQKDRITKLETLLTERETQLRNVGERLDKEREGRTKDQERMARLVLRSRQNIETPEDYEHSDMPTGVYRALQVVPTVDNHADSVSAVVSDRRNEIDERLRKFNPYESTDPPPFPKPPNMPGRAKQKSRPGR